MWRRLIGTGYRSLELPGPGAVAHMSLHQKSTMSKSHSTNEADNFRPPCFHRGSGCPTVLATEAKKAVETVSAASVRGHIWRGSDSVNGFLQFYFARHSTI